MEGKSSHIRASRLKKEVVFLLLLVLTQCPAVNPSNSHKPECPHKVPYGCHCQEKPLEVRCTDTELERIPEDLAEDIVLLSFEGNHFAIVDYVPVVYHSIVALGLDSNNIRYLRENCFQDLEHLKSLHLEYNQISGVHRGTFHGLRSLILLDMSHNNLYELEEGTFDASTLPSLQKLRLSHSKLHQIHPQAFQDLTSLKKLNLSHNALSLQDILSFSNSSFPALTSLDVSYNSLGPYLNFSLFQFQHEVEELYLGHNRIQTIQRHAFTGLEDTLEVLHLQSNNMYYIEQGTFRDLQHLTELDLSHNKLQVLHTDFTRMPQLSTLLVHHNPWQCACVNAWLVLTEAVVRANDNASLICSAPRHLAGIPVQSVPKSIFQQDECSATTVHSTSSHNVLIIASFALAILLTVTCVTVLVVKRSGRRSLKQQGVRRVSAGGSLSYRRMEEMNEEPLGEEL